MLAKSSLKKGKYHDSVSLMLLAKKLTELPGILDAAAVTGTEANKGILAEAGLLTGEAQAADANDLVISVLAKSEQIALAALEEAEALLARKAAAGAGEGEYRPKSINTTVRTEAEANLAVISVAGPHAAAEARRALEKGLHVFLFSDNVPLEDEIELKCYAKENGLLLMGPGAGTAIISGIALGFAKAVPRGNIGLVGASGTGLQEVASIITRQGAGISQAVGVGRRDLSAEVGGITMLESLAILQEDPETEVLVLVSKPPLAMSPKKISA